MNFGTPIRKLGVDVDLEYGVSYSRGTEVVNLGSNENRIVRNTVEASLENRNKEVFDVEVGASFTFNDVEYSLNQALNRGGGDSAWGGETSANPCLLSMRPSWQCARGFSNSALALTNRNPLPNYKRNSSEWSVQADRR